jgi:hypothetical protein
VTEKLLLALEELLPARKPVEQLTVIVSPTIRLPVSSTLSEG